MTTSTPTNEIDSIEAVRFLTSTLLIEPYKIGFLYLILISPFARIFLPSSLLNVELTKDEFSFVELLELVILELFLLLILLDDEVGII